MGGRDRRIPEAQGSASLAHTLEKQQRGLVSNEVEGMHGHTPT